MDKPNVSLIFLVEGNDAIPFDTLNAALNQTFTNFEFLILIAKENYSRQKDLLAWNAAKADSRIRIVNWSDLKSTAEILNFGIEESRAAWLARIMPSEVLKPNMLEIYLSIISDKHDLALVYSDHELLSDPISPIRFPDFDFKVLLHKNIFPDSTFFLKKAWQDVGGFRLNVDGAEAWDFWIACASMGYIGYRIPVSAIYERLHNGVNSNQKTYNFDQKFAQIQLNNRECFSAREVQNAESILGKISSSGGRLAFNPARNPMVSVIIPTYNRPETLKIALDSVFTQTYRDFEIIVVSDCGSNELEAWINSINIRQNVTYVRHGANRGLGAARNTGIGVSRGKYIAYLDDDDYFLPNHLEVLVSHLVKSGGKVVYSDAYRIWQNKIENQYVEFNRDTPYSQDFDYDLILIHNFIPVLCFLHARECITNVGGFDESLSTHEDWDLWIRMSRKYKMDHIKEHTSAFTHRVDGTNMSDRRKINFLDTTTAIYAKYPDFVKDLPAVRAQQELRLKKMHFEFGIPEEPAKITPEHLGILDKVNSGFLTEALLGFEMLVAKGNSTGKLLVDYASLLATLGQFSKAESIYRDAVRVEPRSDSIITKYGDFCFKQGKLQQALELFKVANTLNPFNLEATQLMAELSFSIGEAEIATAFYRRILELEPKHKVALQFFNAKA